MDMNEMDTIEQTVSKNKKMAKKYIEESKKTLGQEYVKLIAKLSTTSYAGIDDVQRLRIVKAIGALVPAPSSQRNPISIHANCQLGIAKRHQDPQFWDDLGQAFAIIPLVNTYEESKFV